MLKTQLWGEKLKAVEVDLLWTYLATSKLLCGLKAQIILFLSILKGEEENIARYYKSGIFFHHHLRIALGYVMWEHGFFCTTSWCWDSVWPCHIDWMVTEVTKKEKLPLCRSHSSWHLIPPHHCFTVSVPSAFLPQCIHIIPNYNAPFASFTYHHCCLCK